MTIIYIYDTATNTIIHTITIHANLTASDIESLVHDYLYELHHQPSTMLTP